MLVSHDLTFTRSFLGVPTLSCILYHGRWGPERALCFLPQVSRAPSSPSSPTAPWCVSGRRRPSDAESTAERSLSDWSGRWPTASVCQVTSTPSSF